MWGCLRIVLETCERVLSGGERDCWRGGRETTAFSRGTAVPSGGNFIRGDIPSVNSIRGLSEVKLKISLRALCAFA